jgi:hypothetical protein
MAVILVNTPCALGVAKSEHMASAVATVMLLERAGHKVIYSTFASMSIVEARNRAVQLMFSMPKVTHILFLDADMSWVEHDAVNKMLEMDKDVIAAGYLTRSLDNPTWTFLRNSEKPTLDDKGNVMCAALPTGFFLAKREVFEKIRAARPDLKVVFHPDQDKESNDLLLFFDSRRIKNLPNYQTDDYGFCETWRELGGEMWLYPDVTITHWAWAGVTANYALNEEYLEVADGRRE